MAFSARSTVRSMPAMSDFSTGLVCINGVCTVNTRGTPRRQAIHVVRKVRSKY